jgi:hypothetical protein
MVAAARGGYLVTRKEYRQAKYARCRVTREALGTSASVFSGNRPMGLSGANACKSVKGGGQRRLASAAG